MIKITLKEYKNIYKLLSAGAEDMEIGISNILNSDLSDASLQILVKALPGRRRHAFIQSFLEQKSIEDKGYNKEELRSKLINDCLPWKELFKIIKKQNPSKVDKEIAEYELCQLYLKGIAGGQGKIIKSLKIELAW